MKSSIYFFLLLIATACGQTQSDESGDSAEPAASGESGVLASLLSTELTEEELNQKLKNKSLQKQKGMRFTVPNDQCRSQCGTDLLKFSGSSPETDIYTTSTCGQVVGEVYA